MYEITRDEEKKLVNVANEVIQLQNSIRAIETKKHMSSLTMAAAVKLYYNRLLNYIIDTSAKDPETRKLMADRLPDVYDMPPDKQKEHLVDAIESIVIMMEAIIDNKLDDRV